MGCRLTNSSAQLMIRRVILSSTLRSDWDWTVRRHRPRFATGSFNVTDAPSPSLWPQGRGRSRFCGAYGCGIVNEQSGASSSSGRASPACHSDAGARAKGTYPAANTAARAVSLRDTAGGRCGAPAGCDHREDGRCALGMSVAAIKHPILRPNNRGGSTTRVRRKCALSVEHTCLACVRARR